MSTKKNIFVAKLTRGAAATAIAGSVVMPPHHATVALSSPQVAQELSQRKHPVLDNQAQYASSQSSFYMTMEDAPSIWDKKLEREFRALALEEAKGSITPKEIVQLEKLSHWRDRLLNPQTVDEILLQMKRDSLLARMENLLKEYVEFQEVADQARLTS